MAFEVGAVPVTLLAVVITAAAVLADPGVGVDKVSDVPASRSYRVVVDARGEERVVVTCPSLADSIGDDPGPFCDDNRRGIGLLAGASATTGTLGVGLLVAARRRRHWLRAERRRLQVLAASDELLTYRQDSMPWSYRVAVVFVGAFFLLNLLGFALELVRDWRAARPDSTASGVGMLPLDLFLQVVGAQADSALAASRGAD